MLNECTFYNDWGISFCAFVICIDANSREPQMRPGVFMHIHPGKLKLNTIYLYPVMLLKTQAM